MTLLDELLDANRRAVQTAGAPGSFVANRHLCIVTCVDPRLTRWFGPAHDKLLEAFGDGERDERVEFLPAKKKAADEAS